MKTVKRAVRSLVRSPLRGVLLAGVLTVSIGLSLIMITVNGAFGERLDEIQAEVGTSITLRPAGSFGGGFFLGAVRGGPAGGGGTTVEPDTAGGTDTTEASALTDEDIEAVGAIEHVAGVSRRLTVQYSGDGLVSSIEPPPQFAGQGTAGFTPPVMITGTDNPASLVTLGVEDAQITAGRTFAEDESEANVAVLGASLAEKNGLEVGDTFPISEEEFEVVGIYSTGTQFGDNSLFLPLETARRLFDRAGEFDEAVVKADTVSNVEKVADAIREALGTDTVDVVTEQSAFGAISAPLSDARDSSRVGMIAALIASAAVILFSVGLVARQRVREIGILKAIGASGWHVIGQFGTETMAVSVLAALLGAAATFPLAQSVANGLVSDPAGPTFGGPGGGSPPEGAVQVIRGGGPASGLLGDVNVAVSPEVFLYALGIAIGLALLATMIPAWYVARVKPAEVLRNE